MIICLDLETAGLDERECGIVEIGAVNFATGETFYRACRPGVARIEPEAVRVNGLTEDIIFSANRMQESLAVSEFIGWARGPMGDRRKVQLAGWNVHFDHRHLLAAMRRASLNSAESPFAHRLIDLHSVLAVDQMRKKLHLTDQSFSTLGNEVENSDRGSTILGLPEEPKPHGALAGARQVRAMLRRVLGDTEAQA